MTYMKHTCVKWIAGICCMSQGTQSWWVLYDNLEGWDRERGGRGVQEGGDMYTYG